MVLVRNVNDNNNTQYGPTEWFQSLPVITKYWFGAAVALTLAGNFQVISPSQLIWNWESVRSSFELWRVLTCFFYVGPFSRDMVITIYMLYTMSVRYEKESPFNTGGGGGTADYCFALMFAMVAMLLTYPLLVNTFPLPSIFAKNLVGFVMYIWSKRNREHQASIWGVPIQATWFPFVYLALTVFIGEPYFGLLHGYAIGHVYYFLVDAYPQVHGKDILVTPNFLIDRFGVGEHRPDRPLQNPNDARPGDRVGSHSWGGGGRPLGRQ